MDTKWLHLLQCLIPLIKILNLFGSGQIYFSELRRIHDSFIELCFLFYVFYIGSVARCLLIIPSERWKLLYSVNIEPLICYKSREDTNLF